MRNNFCFIITFVAATTLFSATSSSKFFEYRPISDNRLSTTNVLEPIVVTGTILPEIEVTNLLSGGLLLKKCRLRSVNRLTKLVRFHPCTAHNTVVIVIALNRFPTSIPAI